MLACITMPRPVLSPWPLLLFIPCHRSSFPSPSSCQRPCSYPAPGHALACTIFTPPSCPCPCQHPPPHLCLQHVQLFRQYVVRLLREGALERTKKPFVKTASLKPDTAWARFQLINNIPAEGVRSWYCGPPPCHCLRVV